MAATAAGGTVAANADSYDIAATRAWTAEIEACAAAECNHCRYGSAACAIDSDDGPVHWPFVTPEITESKEDAEAHMSAARPSHAAAAASSGPEPAPPYIRAELISGGKNAKSRTIRYLDTPSRCYGLGTYTPTVTPATGHRV
ncbi:hypothetical protein MSIM_42890 [Mycobacterium simiae]|nr:hypothetical protein MSIM_42890 [Mycobacterium simiae]